MDTRAKNSNLMLYKTQLMSNSSCGEKNSWKKTRLKGKGRETAEGGHLG